MIRRALVLRLMRYVSYFPWGSLLADASRRKAGISKIVDTLWRSVHADSILRPFTAGGGVLWSPVVLRGDLIRIPGKVSAANIRDGEQLGWLVSRQPPMSRSKLDDRRLPNTLEIDTTKAIVEALRNRKAGVVSVVPILYDCRFLTLMVKKK